MFLWSFLRVNRTNISYKNRKNRSDLREPTKSLKVTMYVCDSWDEESMLDVTETLYYGKDLTWCKGS